MPPVTRATAARLQPLNFLKEQIVALDAAMLVAITSSEVGAVHKLRTTTRRMQAHLLLLDLLGHGTHPIPVPEHRVETEAVLHRLRRIRRAAGAVRDLDVQTSMIRLDAPQKSAVHKGTPGDEVRKQSKQLRKHLEAKRDREAKKLVAVLNREEQELASAMRNLEQTVRSAKRRALHPSVLAEHAADFFSARVGPLLKLRKQQSGDASAQLQRHVGGLDEGDLHAIRKAAKLCRYMMEVVPEHAPERTAAQRYESLQEAGGHWHDWLLLQRLADDFHGRKAALTPRYEKHAASALAEYRLRLAELHSL